MQEPQKTRGFHPRVGNIPWRREWQPTPVFWPGESHGQRSLTVQSMGSQRMGQHWVSTHTHTSVLVLDMKDCKVAMKGCKWKICIGCDVLLSEEWWGRDHPFGMWSCSPAWLSLSPVIKGFYEGIINYPASLVAQMVKSLLAMRETWVRSQYQEDPLEKGMATHFSIPAWRIPWTEEPGGLQSVGSQRVRHDWAINAHTHTHTHTINYPMEA